MVPDSLVKIQQQLIELEEMMLLEIQNRKSLFADIHPKQHPAAHNLIKYLTLRNEDIREFQNALHTHGLSSLASSESHIHRQVQSILQRLGRNYSPGELDTCTYDFSQKQISQKSHLLFGKKEDPASPSVMITFDSSFADDYFLIKELLRNGMNVARINCAHDNEVTWSRMIQQLKRACAYTGLDCQVYMDLAGPKIRTRLLKKGKRKGKVKVKEDGLIWLSDDDKGFNDEDVVISPTEPGIISMLKVGERVYIDDGMIKGVIESTKRAKASVRIVRISSEKQQIKSEKGINFPDSDLLFPSLTEFDKACLAFICDHADMVGYSFVRYPSDLLALQQALKEHSSSVPHIIIKIETPQAVKNLPDLLLQGMRQDVFGVMIARGDLAVEIGFERMGEIQEEILWICEAAHVPVIWATQVLESLNKSGIATRSEITDASHAAMAECVMINKGDYTIKVMQTLKDILRRTGSHREKKRFTFRPLGIAVRFMNEHSQA